MTSYLKRRPCKGYFKIDMRFLKNTLMGIMRCVAFVLVVFTATACTSPVLVPYLHPDVGLNVTELITKHGYPVERHRNVETEDGYLLEMQRIPHGLGDDTNRSSRPPVLFVHGMSASATEWINGGRNYSLAYALADLGYDVWLANCRGTTWSRRHRSLDPKKNKKKFWDFSWHEIGVRDLPAMIDHILTVTGQERLFYVGHSQGTTAFFVMASERPEYNDKVRLMSAFAPVAFTNHMFNPFAKILARFDRIIELLTKLVGIYGIAPNNKLIEIFGRIVCEERSPIHEVCAQFAFLTMGYDSAQFDRKLLPLILTNLPAGLSTKQLLHYAQGVKHGTFRKYDYHSLIINMIKYGRPSPPDYALEKITAPIALHYGQNDWLTSVKDVQILRDRLPNIVYDNKIAYKKFTHLDFLYATDVFELLYNEVIESMKKF